MSLLGERVAHADANRASFVQPVARLATVERVIWLSTVVVALTVY